jgi:hypothetical protein
MRRVPGDPLLAGARIVEGAVRLLATRVGPDRGLVRPARFGSGTERDAAPIARAAELGLLATCHCEVEPATLPAGADQGDMVNPIDARPPGLVVLWERAGRGGQEAVGVYAVSKDPNDPEVRQIKVWLELPNNLRVRQETIRCSLSQPMRMSSNGREFILSELNPGGMITSANRLNHQIWWAACYPEQAGKDPATLAPLARKLGYSGHLVEREQVLPGNTR